MEIVSSPLFATQQFSLLRSFQGRFLGQFINRLHADGINLRHLVPLSRLIRAVSSHHLRAVLGHLEAVSEALKGVVFAEDNHGAAGSSIFCRKVGSCLTISAADRSSAAASSGLSAWVISSLTVFMISWAETVSNPML